MVSSRESSRFRRRERSVSRQIRPRTVVSQPPKIRYSAAFIPAKAQPCLLNRVFGVIERAEHPIGSKRLASHSVIQFLISSPMTNKVHQM